MFLVCFPLRSVDGSFFYLYLLLLVKSRIGTPDIDQLALAQLLPPPVYLIKVVHFVGRLILPHAVVVIRWRTSSDRQWPRRLGRWRLIGGQH